MSGGSGGGMRRLDLQVHSLSLSLFPPIVSLLQYSSHPCERALDGSRIDVDYLKECLNDRERKRR